MTTSRIDPDEFYESRPSLIWSGGMTLLWGLVLFFLWALLQAVGGVIGAFGSPEFEGLRDAFMSGDQEALKTQLTYGNTIWMAALFSSIFGTLLVMLVIYLKKGLTIPRYLHLNSPPLMTWLKWLGLFIGFTVIFEFLAQNIDGLQTDFMENVLKNGSNLPMLVFTIGVAGPIFEEVFFRGFLFKGWENSALGGHGTVILTSVIFAFLHYDQYNLAIVMAIIPMGMLLGYARMYSGSLLVPILLHVLNNLVATWLGLHELGLG